MTLYHTPLRVSTKSSALVGITSQDIGYIYPTPVILPTANPFTASRPYAIMPNINFGFPNPSILTTDVRSISDPEI